MSNEDTKPEVQSPPQTEAVEAAPQAEAKEAAIPAPAPQKVSHQMAEPKKSSLSDTFRTIAGITFAGSLFTTGFGVYFDIGSRWGEMTLGQQLISSTSTLAEHFSVWASAAFAGAIGGVVGASFGKGKSVRRTFGAAAGLGAALIAASFVMPHSHNIRDGVENTLNRVFSTTAEAAAPQAPTLPTPDGVGPKPVHPMAPAFRN